VKNRVKKFMLLLALCAAISSGFSVAAQSVFIRVNEVGFRPDASKTAVVFGPETPPAEFRVVNANTGAVVFTGKTRPLSGRWGEFAHHAELNFTSLTTEGSYVIELDSSPSPQFAIHRNIHADVRINCSSSCASNAAVTTRTLTPYVTLSTAARLMAHCRPALTSTLPAAGMTDWPRFIVRELSRR